MLNPMKKLICLLLFSFCCYLSHAQLKVANIFGDHMILQRNQPVVIWGKDRPGEQVNVSLGGESQTSTSDAQGNWKVTLQPLKDKGPYLLKVTDQSSSVTFKDILAGEVWLCSGQSNMEWKVRSVDKANKEIEAANFPEIRHIEIPKATAFEPQEEFSDAEWQVCSPETVGGFTAVGYFFARKISQELGVPVGLVHSSWGGSHVETWISKSGMLNSEVLKKYAENMPSNLLASNAKMEKLTIEHFHGSKDFDIQSLNEADYLKPDYDFTSWLTINPFGQWDWKGVPSFRGTMYIAKELTLDKNETFATSEMKFGRCTGELSFYVNGKNVYSGYSEDVIKIHIPEGVLNAGKNKILVKFSANKKPEWWGLGFYGSPTEFSLTTTVKSHSLSGDWQALPSWQSERKYAPWMNNEGTLCYNAMIAPLIKLPIKGVLWYQGESNAGRAFDYRKSFKILIKDWREKWQSEFPFYWVQLSSYGPFNDSNTGSPWAELREAQSMALSLTNTGEAVTIDVGNPKDIHPTNKQDVGLRLALNALQHTYGKNLVGSGPRYKAMKIRNNQAILSFDYVGGGLKTANKYGYLEGFEIAGEDQQFYFARAEISGPNVIVSHPKVKKPVAVRYAWSDSPVDANLYNQEGLPASPFRTDQWKGLTEGKHFE